MITYLDNQKFDAKIEASDFRFSATIIGLYRYLTYYNLPYELTDDYLYYNQKDIEISDKYYLFVEKYYKHLMHHIMIQNILEKEDKSEIDLKILKEKLKANSILKKTFKDISTDDFKEIQKVLNENRINIIKETYKNGIHMYRKFNNTNMLEKKPDKTCRLIGFNVDKSKKLKSISYSFDQTTLISNDYIEFDYIPFGFSKTRQAFLINNNFSLKELIETNLAVNNIIENDLVNNKEKEIHLVNSNKALFFSNTNINKYIDYEVQIVIKQIEDENNNPNYKNLYLTDKQIEIFEEIRQTPNILEKIDSKLKLNDKTWINILDLITNNIIQNKRFDDVMLILLKRNSHIRVYNKLNYLNEKYFNRSGKKMEEKIQKARNLAYITANILNIDGRYNKIDSYRQKLITALTTNNKDLFMMNLLKLSEISGITYNFITDLATDFENNKALAYAFLGNLRLTKTKETE